MESIKTLNKIIIVVTAIGGISAIWYSYKTNIWRPKLQVLNVDYDKGIAAVNANGKTKMLYRNMLLDVGGNFGIRFSGDTLDNITRIELYRQFITYKIIDQKKA